MMDQIIVHDLEVRYRVGVPAEERAVPQRLLISLTLDLDFETAAADDRLDFTVDYADVCAWLSAYGDGRSWRLIEALAVAIARDLRSCYPAVVRAAVEVKKFVIPEAAHVAVRCVR